MTDNELIRLFLPIIQNGLINAGYTNVVVKQFNQPTQQGINTGPTVYFSKIGDHRYGSPRRANHWDEIKSQINHFETQMYESTFQIMALVLQDPENPSYTASDLVNEVSLIMQQDSTLDILEQADVGILRILNVTNPYFTDDRDQFEASPSFDFTLTYRKTNISTVPVTSSIELDIYTI